MSNFAFLQQAEWTALHDAATQAKGMANSDARASCFDVRRTLELAVAQLAHADLSRYPNHPIQISTP